MLHLPDHLHVLGLRETWEVEEMCTPIIPVRKQQHLHEEKSNLLDFLDRVCVMSKKLE
jgi:hypothetical protein